MAITKPAGRSKKKVSLAKRPHTSRRRPIPVDTSYAVETTGEAAALLATRGLAVVRVPGIKEKNKIQQKFIKRQNSNFMRTGEPVDTKESGSVLGGFGRIGEPGAWYDKGMNKVRKEAHPVAQDTIHLTIGELHKGGKLKNGPGDYYFSQLGDGPALRLKGTSLSAEAPHRDLTDKNCAANKKATPLRKHNGHPGALVFGGWANLSHDHQFFTCWPGSHVWTSDAANKAAGPGATAGATAGFSTVDKATAERSKEHMVRVRIPRGHMLIFVQTLVHTVPNTSYSAVQLRLFTGWYASLSAVPFFDGILELVRSRTVPPVKSLENAMNFAKLHKVNWMFRLEDWSKKTWDRRLLVKTPVMTRTNNDIKDPVTGKGVRETRQFSHVVRHFDQPLTFYKKLLKDRYKDPACVHPRKATDAELALYTPTRMTRVAPEHK
jgi:hypothetical protein